MVWWFVGVLLFSLIEYFHHRHGGHLRWLGSRVWESHRAHHRDPLDGGASYLDKLRYRAPLVAAALVVLSVPLIGVLGAVGGGFATAGLLCGYAYSEWFHNRMHQRAPTSRLARWMWRYHYVHHFVDVKANFGFTSPFWDYVFGTARLEAAVPVPRVMAPPDLARVPGFRLVGAERSSADF